MEKEEEFNAISAKALHDETAKNF